MKRYKFLDHTADVMFEAYGSNLNELFENAGLALSETMVRLKSVKPRIRRRVIVKNKELDLLLFSFLEELIFLKDSKQILFNRFEAFVDKNKAVIYCYGDKLDVKTMKLGVDVKAVTLHDFKVWEDKYWRCKVVLDI